MKEFDKESLSALLDDEAGELALCQLLKLYDQDTEIYTKYTPILNLRYILCI